MSDLLRPAAFVDRDGTLMREREYLDDPAGVELLPGAAEGLRDLAAAGYLPVIITNQSGIARGYYDGAAYRAVQARLLEVLAAEDVRIAASYHCPHHPDFTGPCRCRKPGTGLFQDAIQALDIDASRSLFIGDRLRDVLPARDFGGRGFLVRTGYGAEEAGDAPGDIVVCDDLPAVAAAVLGRSPRR